MRMSQSASSYCIKGACHIYAQSENPVLTEELWAVHVRTGWEDLSSRTSNTNVSEKARFYRSGAVSQALPVCPGAGFGVIGLR